MKNIIIFALLNFHFGRVVAQINTGTYAKFCNQVGQGKNETINIPKDQLIKCDLTILPIDTNFKVVSFKLTFFSKNKSSNQNEVEVIGNTIPYNLRNQILNGTDKFLIEYIKAKVPDGTIRSLRGITVNIG